MSEAENTVSKTTEIETTKEKLLRDYDHNLAVMLTHSENEGMSINDVLGFFNAGERLYRRVYEEVELTYNKNATDPNQTKFLKYDEERLVKHFDSWSLWDDAINAVHGKAPISKAVELLVFLQDREEMFISISEKSMIPAIAGARSTSPEEYERRIAFDKNMIAVFDQAARVIQNDYDLKHKINFSDKPSSVK